jgi:peptidoglycan/LPS O-acetylase OafA/YrhL
MSYIFINALGISELLSRILAAAGSVDYLIFACLAYFVIERYGRRKVRKFQEKDIGREFVLIHAGYDGLRSRLLTMLDHDCHFSRSH